MQPLSSLYRKEPWCLPADKKKITVCFWFTAWQYINHNHVYWHCIESPQQEVIMNLRLNWTKQIFREGVGVLPTLYRPSSSVTAMWHILTDGSQWSSLINIIWQHCWNYSFIGHRVVNVQVDPFITIGIKSSSVSIQRDWCIFVGLSNTEIL